MRREQETVLDRERCQLDVRDVVAAQPRCIKNHDDVTAISSFSPRPKRALVVAANVIPQQRCLYRC